MPAYPSLRYPKANGKEEKFCFEGTNEMMPMQSMGF